MQFPNKLYSYTSSTLFLLPEVLDKLQNGPIGAIELYQQIKPVLEDTTDFLAALDCLYAMHVIDIDEDSEEIFLCLSK